MTEKIRFEPGEHRYFLGDQEIPGFSHIAKTMGLMEATKFMTDAGREQGTALHKWVNLLARGKTSTTQSHPSIEGRVLAFHKFMVESGFKFESGETPLYEPVSRFSCTHDLAGYLGAFSCVVEVKGGAKQKWHPAQTAAQSLALRANGFRAQKRFTLYLADRSYRLEEHTDAGDEARWKSIVAGYWARTFYI